MDEPTYSCPACGCNLPKFPAKKTKCKNCNNYYYSVRKPLSEQYYIVDESTAVKWRRERRIMEKMHELKPYGITNSEMDIALNKGTSISDCYWSLCNTVIAKNASNNSNKIIIYSRMAWFLFKEGKDPFYILELIAECHLDDIEFKNIGILLHACIVGGRCDKCEHLNGITKPVSEARKDKLIPVSGCSLDYCRAFYSGQVMRDSDGFVITIDNNPNQTNKKGLLNKLIKFLK